MKLTKATAVKVALPPGKSEAIFFDDTLPGFGLRIRAGGKRTWIAQYRIGAKQRRLSLGSLEQIDADEARRRARNALSIVHLGPDPQADKAAARTQASLTLRAVVEQYLTRRARQRLKPRSYEEVERHLRKHWAPLGELPIQRIRRAEVAARLSAIAAENGPFAANRARAALSSLYTWAIGEGFADHSPVTGTNKATDEVSRDRVLSDAELATVWAAAGTGDYGDIVRLLVLTGQRREEVGGMRWSELDIAAAVWRIGADRTKNGLPHEVPLSDQALVIIAARTRKEGRDYLFGSRDGPFQGWSNAKKALDSRALINAPWRLHDLRRTMATKMADLGITPHLIEAILNHISGHRTGVAGVYNRAAYSNGKRQALKTWSQALSNLIGKPSNE